MTLTKAQLDSERERRVGIFEKIMTDNSLDALLLTSTSQQAYQLAVKFASGYQISTRRDIVFMKRGCIPNLVVPTVGQQFHAKRISWLPDENIFSGNLINHAVEMIAGIGKANPKIGTYELNEMPLGMYKRLCSAGVEFVDITRELTEARLSKSEIEVTLIREASRIAVESFEHVVRIIKPGMTEMELIGAAEGFLRKNGAEDSLVLTRSQKPHTFIARAQPVAVKKDGIFVYSAEVAGPYGYWTQLVRPIFMSRDTQPEAYAVLQAILEAEAAGVKKFTPGNKIKHVDIAINEVVAEHKYSTGVWSGHGMGPDLGDGVDIGSENDMDIVPNMVLTLHPSVVGENDGLLYGNTWLSSSGEAECLTGEYAGKCFIDELKDLVK